MNNIKNFEFEKITRSGKKEGIEAVAVEKSYDLIINDVRTASIMASPSDLEELGYGYLLSEGIVKSKDHIISVSVKDDEIDAFIGESEKLDEWSELRSSGCVGVHWEKEEDVSVTSNFKITPALVFQALRHLDTEVYRRTSGSHSASLINGSGEVVARAVDVGRHNAYDKVIGRALLQDIDLSETMLLATGRQSAGMVMKAARVGIPVIVTKAAPLSSGIDAAKKTGVTLICFADEGKFSIFAGGKRVNL